MMAKLLVLEALILGAAALPTNDSGNSLHRDAPDGPKMHVVTAKDTALAYLETLKEELPGLREVNLLATQPKDVSVTPQAASMGNTSSVVPRSSGPDDHVSEFEKDVTDLVGVGASERWQCSKQREV
jgi:hypothetical protein